MIYLLGDLQGCCDAFERLLAEIDFSPSRDQLYALGDLVNRGPASLQVLERLQGLGNAATCLLGNHDLHLLAVAAGARKLHRNDTLAPILDAPRRAHHLAWLREQRMAVFAQGWLMVHAGVLPAWTVDDTLRLAGEVEAVLRSPDCDAFLHAMYANAPAQWRDAHTGHDRIRVIVNALTRLRFCSAEGVMDFKLKEDASAAPPGLMPWFEVPGRKTLGARVAFGHWSTLGGLHRPDLLALDTGCVWGGSLSAACLEADGRVREVVAVRCEQAQRPG